ncbi:ROK family protein [Nonomuraea sp. NPDC049684]|uniref:ROK family protein n=1 Tax=Nonomuraea sp. NPDC049684 TaxID=3364356 RepID=UPI0037AF46D0
MRRRTNAVPAVLGIDIGGTKTAAALIPASAARETTEIHLPARVPTPAGGGAAAVLAAALELAEDRLAQARAAGMDVIACGVGSAGTVDDNGVVTHATDALPGWRGTDLASAFTERLGLPVTVLNDVHAWALGEARHGAARGRRLALVLTIGTGVGGALVRDGELLRGRNGMAGSLGHTPAVLPPNTDADRPCPCGATGHLEAYASGPAILSAYHARGGTAPDLGSLATPLHNTEPPTLEPQPTAPHNTEPRALEPQPAALHHPKSSTLEPQPTALHNAEPPALVSLRGTEPPALRAPTGSTDPRNPFGTAGRRDGTENADLLAREVIHEAAVILGRSIASAATLLDPDVIVLGGGVTGLGELLTVPLIETIRRYAPRGLGSVPVRLSALGSHGAVLGAASAAMA